MADLLLDLLTAQQNSLQNLPKNVAKSTKLLYLTHVAEQTAASLESTEPPLLAQSTQSLLISLQGVSKRSHKSIVDSAFCHYSLDKALPGLVADVAELQNAIPKLDSEALSFSTTYSKSSDNHHLSERKKALLLSRNVERLVDVLELPTLLSSAISTVPVNYATALDLNGHIRRLHTLYSTSPLVSLVSRQADEAIHRMTADLVATLKAPGLKLATSLRTVSWLRRILPDVTSLHSGGRGAQERALALLFLTCRITTLDTTLGALEPLRELADEEKARQNSSGNAQSWSGGQQTERYLKRYVEIFREQSFGIISMFRSIFPDTGVQNSHHREPQDPLQPLPSVLSTFPLYLVGMLLEALRVYLPVIKDQAARDSILTQVLYCSGSLGRLGGDFGVLLAGLGSHGGTASKESEWVDIVKRHRLLAGRLESVIGDYRGVNAKET